MPAWTLGTLMSETTAALGNRADLALSRVSFFVNEAYRMVAEDLHQHNRMEAVATTSTTSGDACVNLPTDFYELISLSNTSTAPPYLLRQVNVDFVDSYSTAQGEPQYFASYATFLELVPTPDSSYSIQMRYRAELGDMTSTSSVPSLATRYHYAVYLKAQEVLAANIGDAAKASFARAQYDAYMRDAPSDTALRHRQNRRLGLSLKPSDLKGRRYDFDNSDE